VILIYEKTAWHSFNKLKKDWLKDPEFKKDYDALGPEYKLIDRIIEKRIQKKMTQKELAQKIGTRQSAISRLESGNGNPTIGFLQKVASALDTRVTVTFH